MNAEWGPRIGAAIDIGVGVNTGVARVGNIGTRYKFKYGALGHAVNVASRVQGATRAFGMPVLVTASTRAGLPDDAPVRRLGKVRVVGVREPVELYELAVDPGPDWFTLRSGYEEALAAFEEGRPVADALGPVLLTPAGQGDAACRLLAERAAAGVGEPVLELAAK